MPGLRKLANCKILLDVCFLIITIGIIASVFVKAGSSTISLEPELGTLSAGATTVTDQTTNVVSVKFGAAPVPVTAPLYQRAAFGAFAGEATSQMPYGDGLQHARLEQLVGAKFKRVSIFAGWGEGLNSNVFQYGTSGHDLLVAWDTQYNGSTMKFSDLLSGKYDQVMRDMFTQAKNYTGTVTYRPFWEFNAAGGSSAVAYGGADRSVTSTQQWIDAWRYIVNFQRSQVPSSNIKWFWCANGSDVTGPNGTYTMEQYWPGAQYVDEAGFDTYNDKHDTWKTFDQKVGPIYDRVVKLSGGTVPIAIGEIGTRNPPSGVTQTKGQWLAGMYTSTLFPLLKHVDYFHVNKEENWRYDSAPDGLAAAQQYQTLNNQYVK